MGKLLYWAVLFVVGIVALKVFFVAVGIAFGLAAFLIFKVLPVVLVGWLVVKAWRIWKEKPAS